MKLEFLEGNTGGGKYPSADPKMLLRLYDFDVDQLLKFRQEIQTKLVEGNGELAVSSLEFVQPLNCRLTFQVSEDDLGIRYDRTDKKNFIGKFSRAGYNNMLEIIDRLADGYNWLYDPETEDQIDLLLSPGGGW